MTIRFGCPSCGRVLRSARDVSGRRVRCKSCDELFVVAESSREAAPTKTPDGGVRAARAAPVRAQCNHSEFPAGAKRRLSFLGFVKSRCPGCGREILHPLSEGYRTLYYVILALGTFGFIAFALSHRPGEVMVPGLLFLVILYAVIRDVRLRHRIRGSSSRREP